MACCHEAIVWKASHEEKALHAHSCTPPTPTPNRMYKGAACLFPFSRARGYFWPLVSGIFCWQKPERGVLNQSPDIWGIFQKLPEKLRNRGYDNILVSRDFNSPPIARKGGRALIILYICGRAPRGYIVHNGKICTHHNPRARGEEKKKNGI